MNQIIKRQQLNDDVFWLEIKAPEIAQAHQAGQFVIVRIEKKGERIPLTIADKNKKKGTITLIVQAIGYSTKKMSELQKGDYIQDIVGPLGTPTKIKQFDNSGAIIIVGGGVGIAPLYSIAKAFKKINHKVIAILGGRKAELIILQKEFEHLCDEVYYTTDDGSLGHKGLVTDTLTTILKKEKVNEVITAGPTIMMKFVAQLTKEYKVKTIVSLNSLMVDGTGMCGGCRVTVNGKTKFTCIDGPEFDGHQVNFDSLINRLGMYKDHECQLEKKKNLVNTSPSLTSLKEENKKVPLCEHDLGEEKLKKILPGQMPRQKMLEQSAEIRKNNFQEVNLGLTEEQAIKEASRCLQCKRPICVQGCPVQIDIPKFIQKITEREYLKAVDIILQDSIFPSICGRVCPQEKQCEQKCILNKKFESVAIGNLERFVGDYACKENHKIKINIKEKKEKVAIIGGGPSGLTCAGDLRKKGYQVTIYEALHVVGGVLRYGIPDFRLPSKVIESEIKNILDLGVEIKTNSVIGKLKTINQLFEEGYSAIYISVGAGFPRFMNIPGENLNYVYSANEYLTRVNLMEARSPKSSTPIAFGQEVAVIGGGNTAMDSIRTALRLGAKKAHLIYRRTEKELPARLEEFHHAKEEGVKFHFLCSPVEFIGEKNQNNSKIKAIKCQKMKLGLPDESGRCQPVPTNEFITIPCDVAIIAIGTLANPIIAKTTDLELNQWGYIETKDDLSTSHPGIFAGGDITSGGATVIAGMGAGRKAAKSIDRYIQKK